MCSRIRQDGHIVGPGQKVKVRHIPSGEMFEDAVFAGCARRESLGWWKRQGATAATIDAEGFAERNKATRELIWDDIPAGNVIQAMLEPQPPGKDYRLLKVVTRNATEEELAKYGNDRVPLTAPVVSEEQTG